MARSLKLNYYDNTSRVYIYKIQLENYSCSRCCVVCKKGFWFALRCATFTRYFVQNLVLESLEMLKSLEMIQEKKLKEILFY
jgi:hypothetical protein